MDNAQLQTLLATVIRQYGQDDGLTIDFEVYATLPGVMRINAQAVGDGTEQIKLSIEEQPAPAVRPSLRLVGGTEA